MEGPWNKDIYTHNIIPIYLVSDGIEYKGRGMVMQKSSVACEISLISLDIKLIILFLDIVIYIGLGR